MNVSLKPKKIAIFHCGFIYSGGGERIVLEEALGLMERGYQVIVRAPTLNPKKCYPDFLDKLDIDTFFPQFPERIQSRYAIQMVLSSLLAPFFAYKFRDVDVFVGANQPGAWLAFWMSKILRKPSIIYMNQPNRLLYPREVDQENGWVNEKSYEILAQLIWMGRHVVKFVDHLSSRQAKAKLVNGSYIGGVIEGIYKMETKDCPAAAHPRSEQELLKKGEAFKGSLTIGKYKVKKPYVLLTNRHDPQKKFEYVIEAMRQVKRKFPEVQLVIPGPFTAHTPRLVELAKRLRVARQVLFLGQISEAALQKLYKQAAVYVYPSPQEDFGMGPLEAGAWAVPTIAWNNAGPTVTIRNGVTGFLARPFVVKDYAERMIDLLADSELQYKMGRAAWRRVMNKFSWKRHVDILEKEILRVYEENNSR